MAKETTIIFLYDTELLKREEDDPNSAILYFYPTWVSEQQKTALCGQLMGTMLCLKSVLAMPKTVCLQTGKFFLIENGRYILVVGTDTNIPGSVLEHRANLINSLVNFFHKDFITLGRLYEKDNLTAKLYHIFDTYLKLLFLGGCPFNQIPLSNLPKTDSDVLTSAQAILEHCKTIPQVLGGIILYHNKVLYTQLCAETTKKIVFSDPFRIKNPAELLDLSFEVPEGVKLLQVHIPAEEYEELFRNSACNVNSLEGTHTQPDSTEIEAVPTSLTKINSSILFTSVPEDATFSPHKVVSKKPPENRKNKRSRPNSLNLKSCSLDSAGDTQSGRRLTPITPYWTQSSLVCTPMTETKSFVDQAATRTSKENVWRISSMGFHKLTLDHSIETFQCPLEVYSRRLEKAERLSSFVRAALEKTSTHRSSSLQNLSQINSIPNPLNQYSSCRNKVCFKTKKSINLRRCKSIHDPAYPWCKGDAVAASQYYVEEVLDEDFFVEREQCTFRELITERKRSLTLPIKPHNASEAQKTDMKSPGGYCTPLMNKLSMSNVLERQTSSKDIPLASFVAKDETEKTDRRCELRRCVLFMFGERDLVLASLLNEDCLRNKTGIETLQKLCNEQLATLEERIKVAMEPLKPITSPEAEAYSMLSFDGDWGTLQRSGPWDGADLNDLTRLHRNFGDYKDITEIYLRKPESVLYGHREGGSEAFYLEAAALTDGLLLPNDAMGLVHQTAKRRLEKNHDVFIK